MNLIAGFECGYLHWNNVDLLEANRHTPQTDMREHYINAIAKGATSMRDGLPPGHDPSQRLGCAQQFPVIWDLLHYHPCADVKAHATSVREALDLSLRFGDAVLPVNEPSVHVLWNRPVNEVIDDAIVMIGEMGDWPIMTCDPFHDLDDATFYATDRLVETGRVGAVGVNYYPHHGNESLRDVMNAVRARYDLPVLLSETGWHEGHPGNARFPHIHSRREWWDHVLDEVGEVGGVCWYPWLDQRSWDDPFNGEMWHSGWPE